MADDLDEARALLPGWTLHPADALGGSDRSAVRRAQAIRPDGRPTTVIVKTFLDRKGWVRESAALAVVPAQAPAPRLLAAGSSPPVVVMGDLGRGASVADALLGSDPSAATAAVYAWTDAIAAMHRTTVGVRDAFWTELRARAEPAGSVPLTAVSTWLDKTVGDLSDVCAAVGIALPQAVVDRFHADAAQLDNDAASALSPADACPDNNVFTGDRLTLIDFETAEWRHVAWDVAYLRVPWPTCWCSWRLPDDVADRAVARYREAMAAHLPYVATPDFDDDLATATDMWSLLYSSWLLPQTLTDDPLASRRESLTPRRRALVLNRLDTVRRSPRAAEIAAFAEDLRKALVDRWGEVPLAPAPAFRG